MMKVSLIMISVLLGLVYFILTLDFRAFVFYSVVWLVVFFIGNVIDRWFVHG